MAKTIFEATRGSDITLVFTWTTPDDTPFDLTNCTLAVLDAGSVISNRFSARITDAAGGVFEVFIEGSSPIAVGFYDFRVQIVQPDGDSIATPLMGLNVV